MTCGKVQPGRVVLTLQERDAATRASGEAARSVCRYSTGHHTPSSDTGPFSPSSIVMKTGHHLPTSQYRVEVLPKRCASIHQRCLGSHPTGPAAGAVVRPPAATRAARSARFVSFTESFHRFARCSLLTVSRFCHVM